jgi:hypothetical protein
LIRWLCAALALLCLPITARAERITDDTPFVLAPGEVRLGLGRIQAGVPIDALAGLEIGTMVIPWAGWFFDLKTANGHAEYQFLEAGPFAASVGAGLFVAKMTKEKHPGRFLGVPLSLLGAYRLSPRFILSGGVQGVYLHADGSYDERGKHEGQLQGAVAAHSLSLQTQLEWQLSRHFSLVGGGRLLGYTRAHGAAHADIRINDDTQLMAFGTGSIHYAEKGVGSLFGGYVHWTAGHFHARLGGWYGNYSIPGIYFILPKPMFVPEVDLFVRF